jgi:hypothetical protein
MKEHVLIAILFSSIPTSFKFYLHPGTRYERVFFILARNVARLHYTIPAVLSYLVVRGPGKGPKKVCERENV